MSNYYEPSGKFSTKSILIFLLMSVTLYPLLAVLYAYGIKYVPFVYILFIFTAIYGVSIGFTSYFVVLFGKVRSKPFSHVITVLGVLVSLYFHWVFWVSLVLDSSNYLELALNPLYLIDIIKEINLYGTWNLKSSAVNGIFLTILWLVELIVIIITSFVTVKGIGQVNAPFCEVNNEWFDDEELSPFNFIEDNKLFTSNLEVKNLEILDSIEKNTDSETVSHSKFTLYFSKTNEYYLSVKNQEKKFTKEGKIEFDEIEIFENLRINKEIADRLKAI